MYNITFIMVIITLLPIGLSATEPKDISTSIQTSPVIVENEQEPSIKTDDKQEQSTIFPIPQEHNSSIPIAGSLTPEQQKKLDQVKFVIDAAKKGDADAMFYLSLLLKKARKEDESSAWMQEAIKRGNEMAINFTSPDKESAYDAGLHAMTIGLREDAYRLFIIAAEDGNAMAQLNLGILYDQDKDKKNAYKWYKKAAAQGQPTAQAILTLTSEFGVEFK